MEQETRKECGKILASWLMALFAVAVFIVASFLGHVLLVAGARMVGHGAAGFFDAAAVGDVAHLGVLLGAAGLAICFCRKLKNRLQPP